PSPPSSSACGARQPATRGIESKPHPVAFPPTRTRQRPAPATARCRSACPPFGSQQPPSTISMTASAAAEAGDASPPLLAVVGATGTGKSELSLAIADKLAERGISVELV